MMDGARERESRCLRNRGFPESATGAYSGCPVNCGPRLPIRRPLDRWSIGDRGEINGARSDIARVDDGRGILGDAGVDRILTAAVIGGARERETRCH